MFQEDRGANAVERTQKAEIKKAESLASTTLPVFKTHPGLRETHPGLRGLRETHPGLRERTFGSCGLEVRSCVKAEVAVLGSPSLIVLIVSVDVKQP